MLYIVLSYESGPEFEVEHIFDSEEKALVQARRSALELGRPQSVYKLIETHFVRASGHSTGA